MLNDLLVSNSLRKERFFHSKATCQLQYLR